MALENVRGWGELLEAVGKAWKISFSVALVSGVIVFAPKAGIPFLNDAQFMLGPWALVALLLSGVLFLVHLFDLLARTGVGSVSRWRKRRNVRKVLHDLSIDEKLLLIPVLTGSRYIRIKASPGIPLPLELLGVVERIDHGYSSGFLDFEVQETAFSLLREDPNLLLGGVVPPDT